MKNCCKLLLVCLMVSSYFTPLLGQEILPPLISWDGKSKELMVDKTNKWVTPCELTDFKETPDYNATMAWLKKLTEASPYSSLVSIGESAQGRQIQMVIASKDQDFTHTELSKSTKPLLLIQAGIHSGEIDGKDAGMMLLRDIVFGNKMKLLDGANLLFVPILSVDGHERKSKYGRVNQRGPEIMGWRTNAQNLNLNRDYTKLETAGIQSIVKVINDYDPDLYIDIHVTDGADYQCDVTYGFIESGGFSPNISGWLHTYFRPEVDRALKEYGHTPGPFLNPANGKDFSDGNSDYGLSPRYSDSYGDLRHLPTILVENHSLKPYQQRVLGTYIFLEQTIKTISNHFTTLNKAINLDKKQRNDSLVIKYQFGKELTDSIWLQGIESVRAISKITGAEYVQWTGKPTSKTVSTKRMDQPAMSIKVPKAYWIPAEWTHIIEKVKAHGIKVEMIEDTREITTDQYFLTDYKLSSTPFEGRVRMGNVVVKDISRKAIYYPGSARILTDQPLGALASILLEPKSTDSYFQWGYFHSILSRTEYIEHYVMDPLAEKMLKEDPDLKKRFESLLKSDSSFASSPQKIYAWFYEQTPYYDKNWKVIPIGREW